MAIKQGYADYQVYCAACLPATPLTFTEWAKHRAPTDTKPTDQARVIKVQVKYNTLNGAKAYQPVNQDARYVCALTGRNTLDQGDFTIMMHLGFTIMTLTPSSCEKYEWSGTNECVYSS